MAAPSDAIASQLRIGTDAELSGFTVRSHLSDGRVVAWTGPSKPAVAIDAELERPVPRALAARHGTADFWGRWTRMECVAKLTGTPAVLLQRDLDRAAGAGVEARVSVETLLLDGEVVVSVGRRCD